MNMKLISPAKLKELITKRNKAFEGKTNAEKRVLIAKDVLQQIKKGFFVPQRNKFVNIISSSGRVLFSHSQSYLEENVRELLMQDSSKCQCCALGGLMLSCTLFNNKTTTKDSNLFYLGDGIKNGDKFSNGLNEIFSREQLELIENAYELGRGYFGSFGWGTNSAISIAEENRAKAIEFGNKFPLEKDRLRAIMRNIIKNKGEFIPDEKASQNKNS